MWDLSSLTRDWPRPLNWKANSSPPDHQRSPSTHLQTHQCFPFNSELSVSCNDHPSMCSPIDANVSSTGAETLCVSNPGECLVQRRPSNTHWMNRYIFIMVPVFLNPNEILSRNLILHNVTPENPFCGHSNIHFNVSEIIKNYDFIFHVIC